jgi:tRNA A37 N6-isopentenylltransferase MiaA
LYTNNHAIEELNALKAIGYGEIIESLKQKTPLNIDKIKQRTRNYAKRQLT